MTSSYHPENERIKRRYFIFLKEAKQYSEATLDAVASSIYRFEEYNRFRSFKTFRAEQAIAFKAHLATCFNARTKELLSKATAYSTLANLRSFFQWLSREPGFKAQIQYSDADYFRLSLKDSRAAKSSIDGDAPTLDQVRKVLESMPCKTDVELRDRAVVALILLTGARDNAVASLKIKHVDLDRRRVIQDGKEVRTKFSKTIITYFFPVGDDVFVVLRDWILYLRHQKQWVEEDPLFPATKVAQDEQKRFSESGLARRSWSNAAAIRNIFKNAFERAGLPYFKPHSIRKTLVGLGQSLCTTPEEFKAWSQNLGHEDVLLTWKSYGQIADRRQAEILKSIGRTRLTLDEGGDFLAEEIAALLNRHRQRK